MASGKVFIILVLVALVAFDSANCYFRLGREMETRHAKQRSVSHIEQMITAKVLQKVANCIAQVKSFQYFFKITSRKLLRTDQLKK